ncbi:MAG: sugar phosphate isomerase/epimerase family protein, partial [Phycisphaerae bacterium]
MTRFDRERIDFARRHAVGCVELMTPQGSDYLPGNDGWKDRADTVKGAFDEAGIRISCLAGFYGNHMDPAQSEQLKQHTRSVIELAAYLKVPVVAGFAGRLVDRPLEDSLPLFKQIWSEHARFAEQRGIRIAFEHCPMGRHHLPPGGINCICTPAMWERCFNE